jgi:hypothetical protein
MICRHVSTLLSTLEASGLTVLTPDHGPKIAATATSGVLLLGDEASVKASVDRGGKDGLAESKTFSSAMDASRATLQPACRCHGRVAPNRPT